MMRRPPRYVQGFVDRHGRPRWYLRKPGIKRVALPGLPWSPEFMAAYETALAGETGSVGSRRTKPGSISALVAGYYASSEYRNLRPITQRTYRGVMEAFREQHGDRAAAGMDREHIKAILGKMSDRPSAANNWLKAIKILMRHAVEIGMRRDDPSLGIRKMRTGSSGYRTWTEEEIQQFQAAHPLGTRARLALDLLLHTGQRRADVVRMGRQHVRNGVLTIEQSKTGTEVAIPLHSAFTASLEALPVRNMTFLLTEFGRPFTPDGFGNWFRDRVAEAGLPVGLAPHGLRKAACRRLAEAGCTANEIMSISGHRNLKEVALYTEAASRSILARRAMSAVWEAEGRTEPGTRIVKPAAEV